ncbi:iron dicitrate transport regulator FecR, partial [Caulobacter hibisci]|nr:iron dicitrate transport regulator FecR [Caulobacter hibisci]
MEATVLTRPEAPALTAEATRMFQEAGEASAVVARQLAANAEAVEKIAERLRASPPRAVVTCARG